jgi:hypothetical protein
VWRGCRSKAGHLPRRPVHGERGNHLGIALPAAQPGRRRAGSSSTDEPGMGRSPRSSRRSGKPATWRRRAANPQGVDWNARRSPVNTDAPSPTLDEAEARVLGIQRKLHRQTTPDVCRMGSWRAGCGESRTSGSEGGPEKPTDRKVDRALWPDPYCGATGLGGWLTGLGLTAVGVRATVDGSLVARSPGVDKGASVGCGRLDLRPPLLWRCAVLVRTERGSIRLCLRPPIGGSSRLGWRCRRSRDGSSADARVGCGRRGLWRGRARWLSPARRAG